MSPTISFPQVTISWIPPFDWLVTSIKLFRGLLLASLFLPQTLAAQETKTLFQFEGAQSWGNVGRAVSDAGDVNADGVPDFIVGAPHESQNAGTAYVFSGANGDLLHTFGGITFGDRFGCSVSGAGDANSDGYADLIIGASGVDVGPTGGEGAVYLFSGVDGALIYQISGSITWGQLGLTVAVSGDIDGDGVLDFLVGEPGDYPGGAYVYSGSTGGVIRHHSGSLLLGQSFGESVSGIGDINGDGIEDYIIGDPAEDSPLFGNQTGAAYIYSGASGGLLRHITATSPGARFGSTVASAGTGTGKVLVAADGGLGANGYVRVHHGLTGVLVYQLNPGQVWDFFGASASSFGDIDGDSVPDLAVGAPRFDNNSGTDAGAVYIFSGATGTLLHLVEGTHDSEFGFSVSAAGGDVDGDGLPDIIVGADEWDPLPWGPQDAGAAFVIGFNPYLRSDTAAVSASTGGTVNLSLDFPTAAAGDYYRVLISASGTGPTTYGVEIPLTLDSLLVDTFLGIYPMAIYSDMHGTLDGAGNGTASFDVPAGLPSGLIGRTYWTAAIASQVGHLPEYSSVAVSLEIVP